MIEIKFFALKFLFLKIEILLLQFKLYKARTGSGLLQKFLKA